MLRSAGKRRALSVLEKRGICRKRLGPEHAKENLSDFGKNFIGDEVGNYIYRSESDTTKNSKSDERLIYIYFYSLAALKLYST